MNKKFLTFVKVIYYIFTFMIGILLAIVLPNILLYDTSMNIIRDSLENKKYEKAMELVGGYFDRNYVFEQSFDEKSGIVLFSAATLVYNTGDENDETVDETKLQKSYAGFIYGIHDSYNVLENKDNKTKLVATNTKGEEYVDTLIDYDSDGDGNKDAISTLYEKGFIYLEFNYEACTDIKNIKFIDKEGTVFKSVDFATPLSYNEAFFNDVNEFLEEYNRDYKSDKLIELDQEFLKNSNYAKSTNANLSKASMQKSIFIVVAYFLIIYLVADLLLGKRYVIKFFKWLFSLIFRKTKKDNKSNTKEFFDYYTSVTLTLDLSLVDNFNESVRISYSNSDQKIEFILLAENGYKETKRIKAGTYVNPWFEANRDYEALNLPENLVVEGYKMDVEVKINKVERNEE